MNVNELVDKLVTSGGIREHHREEATKLLSTYEGALDMIGKLADGISSLLGHANKLEEDRRSLAHTARMRSMGMNEAQYTAYWASLDGTAWNDLTQEKRDAYRDAMEHELRTCISVAGCSPSTYEWYMMSSQGSVKMIGQNPAKDQSHQEQERKLLRALVDG